MGKISCGGMSQAHRLPQALLLVLTASVLARMLAHPYSFCDDLTHYFSLHEAINGGVQVQTPGGNLQAIHAVLTGIRLVFAPLARLCRFLGAEYPILAASQLWALCMLPLSFLAWSACLEKSMGKILGAWAALAIALFNVVNHIIPAGLARSANVLLLALWCLALRKRSPAAIAGVLLTASLLYPVILPVLGISLFFCTAWTWRDKESCRFRAGVLALGFVAATTYMATKSFFSFRAYETRPMTYGEMLATLAGGDFTPNLDIPRLIGRMGSQSVVEWFQFNGFNYPNRVEPAFEIVIAGCVLGMCAAGFAISRLSRSGARPRASWLIALFPLTGAIAAFREGDFFLATCWFCALAALGWAIAPPNDRRPAVPEELRLLVPASLAAFLAVHIACYSLFVMVLDPGRQLQKTFAILAPISTVLLAARLFESLDVKRSGLFMALLGTCAAFYGCWALDLGYHEYGDERAMRVLRDLPPGSEVLCHPQTADFVLIMAGQGASTAHELVRIGAQPFTRDILAAYARDVDLLYSAGPEKLRQWCGESPRNRYILVEPEIYAPEETGRLFGPYNRLMEARRAQGYYLPDKLEGPLKTRIGKTASLVPCPCLLRESGPQASGEAEGE